MNRNEIYSLEWTNRVKTIGRVFVYNNRLWLSFSGTGIEFMCNGGFKAVLTADEIPSENSCGFARVAILKDGCTEQEVIMNTKTVSIQCEAEGVHSFSIVKLSESNESSVAVSEPEAFEKMQLDDGTEVDFCPTEAKAGRIEILGDSITCGYGVEGNLSETFTTATENVSLAWGYLTASKLNYDYSIISKSGSGIISGYTPDGVRNTDNIYTVYYDKMGCTQYPIEGDTWARDIDYDFSFEPDIVMVLLGTNDISYCRPYNEAGKLVVSEEESENRKKEFYIEYKRFLRRVRELNPFAKIVCALGVMGTALNEQVSIAVNELCAEGDSRIYWLELSEQDAENDGYGTDFHPSKITQKKVSEKVVDFLRSII